MNEVAPPLYATIIYISALQMLNFIILREVLYSNILGAKYNFGNYEEIILPTIFLALNYLYFTYDSKYKKILNHYDNQAVTKKHKFYNFLFCWIYPIVTFSLLIVMIFFYW